MSIDKDKQEAILMAIKAARKNPDFIKEVLVWVNSCVPDTNVDDVDDYFSMYIDKFVDAMAKVLLIHKLDHDCDEDRTFAVMMCAIEVRCKESLANLIHEARQRGFNVPDMFAASDHNRQVYEEILQELKNGIN